MISRGFHTPDMGPTQVNKTPDGCLSMNGLPYYKRYPRDFIEGTIGMPFELKVTYSFLLDLIYMQAGELPDDARYISGILGVSVRKWNSLRAALLETGKISAENGKITNYRAVIELESTAKYQRKQSENGSAPNKNNGLEKPSFSHTDTDTVKKEGKPSQKRATRLPENWTLPKTWGDWALDSGYNETLVREQADIFKDYWVGVSGVRATKLDWLATWRNWMRRNGKQVIKGGGYDKPSKSKERFNAFISGARGAS